MRIRLLLIPLLLSATPAPRHQAPGVSITFLANEGVLISDGTKGVIIDGLFERYGPEYAVPHDSIQRALASARAPFDAVDVVLVTHRHGDHFHPAPMLSHLEANRRATLVTSSQVIDSLLSSRRPPVRVLRRTTPAGQQRREVINGVPIEIIGIAHGSERHRAVEHLGFIVELGGRRVLHVGDVGGSEADFAPLRLDTARVDVALVPSWMVMSASGRAAIEKWIKPKQVVAFHFADGDFERGPKSAMQTMPESYAFSRSMETRRW